MARIRPENANLTLELELREIRGEIAAAGLAVSSQHTYSEVLRRFELFLRHGLGVGNLHEISREHVARFVRAPPEAPAVHVSVATMHTRRAALRLAFRIARERGLLDHDPTLDLNLARRKGTRCRPLDWGEIERCRSASVHSIGETRLPAAWALAEATATSPEIALIRPNDVDLYRRRVRLFGGGHLMSRWGDLTEWGAEQIDRRMQLQDDRTAGLVYRGHGSANSAQASVSQAIRWSLVRAGLGADPSVKPSSIRGWRARSWADEGVPVQEIAARLGMRSLDRVIALIVDDGR